MVRECHRGNKLHLLNHLHLKVQLHLATYCFTLPKQLQPQLPSLRPFRNQRLSQNLPHRVQRQLLRLSRLHLRLSQNL